MRTPIAFLLACATAGAAALQPPAGSAPAAPVTVDAAAGGPGAPGPAPALAELVERAWSIRREASVLSARAAELDARALANRAFFAGAPVVGLDLRRDLPRDVRLPGTEVAPERGRNELEPGISAPIWLPGQRDAQRRVIEREREALSAVARLARLQLAGEVREAAWAVARAAAERRLQQARLDAARALEADVARRVDAGDLAPVDRLLARAEALAAEAALRDAAARVGIEQATLRRLTGVDTVGEIGERPGAAADAHPALTAARDAALASRARLDYARATRRDNPTVSAVARFDRDAYGSGYRNSLRIGIAVPLDTEARNAPRLAAASAELAEAEIALQRREREVAAGVERAGIGLAAARAALEANVERARVSGDAHAAIERAFRAGERSLPELLRVRAQALEAELARDTAREQTGLAIARLNQAMGIEP